MSSDEPNNRDKVGHNRQASRNETTPSKRERKRKRRRTRRVTKRVKNERSLQRHSQRRPAATIEPASKRAANDHCLHVMRTSSEANRAHHRNHRPVEPLDEAASSASPDDSRRPKRPRISSGVDQRRRHPHRRNAVRFGANDRKRLDELRAAAYARIRQWIFAHGKVRRSG